MKRLQVVILTALFLLIFSSLPAAPVLAQSVTDPGDTPSSWAREEVGMAQLYGLGTEDNYGDYLSPASGADLFNIEASIGVAFTVSEPAANNKSVLSKKDAIYGLYDIISAVLQNNGLPLNGTDALAFFIDNGIVAKQADNNYALTAPISRQDLLIYAKRAYEYLRYALDLDSKGAFWKVSDADNTVYLLGSIHVADSATYPLSKKILNAYESSDFLVVEADITAEDDHDYAYIGEKGLFLDDTTIKDLISSATYAAYADAMAEMGYEKDVYNRIKPWYASWIVEPEPILYAYEYGIDRHFLTRAGYDHKPIIEMEGAELQIDVSASFSPALQEALLSYSLQENAEDSDKGIGVMLDLWQNGDTGTLEYLFIQDGELSGIDKEYDDKLTNDRNAGMVKKVLTYLENDRQNDYFVVLGTAHYLGDTGIVEQLRLQGYTVTQIR